MPGVRGTWVKRGLAVVSLLLLTAGVYAALDQPNPDPMLHANPCDKAFVSAFHSRQDDGSDPELTQFCRNPARRQLAIAVGLVLTGSALLIWSTGERRAVPEDDDGSSSSADPDTPEGSEL